jgi:leader peptidase (prepilin peptidase)/N-methyltransferase
LAIHSIHHYNPFGPAYLRSLVSLLIHLFSPKKRIFQSLMSIILAIFIGLASGFLIDYLADTLPTRQKWTRPGCYSCGATRQWQDYFLLASCRTCHKSRPWRSSLIIAAMVFLSVFLALYPHRELGYWFSFLLVAFFGLVIIIDVEHRLIMHVVTLGGAVIGVVVGSINHGFLATLLGGVLGFVLMFIFYLLGVQFARFRARRQGLEVSDEEALGFGDVTISGVLGLMLGVTKVLYGITTGILLAGVFSVLLIIGLLVSRKFKSGNIYIPYGPFLVLGACVYIFFR